MNEADNLRFSSVSTFSLPSHNLTWFKNTRCVFSCTLKPSHISVPTVWLQFSLSGSGPESKPTSTWYGVYPERVKARDLRMGVTADGDSGVGCERGWLRCFQVYMSGGGGHRVFEWNREFDGFVSGFFWWNSCCPQDHFLNNSGNRTLVQKDFSSIHNQQETHLRCWSKFIMFLYIFKGEFCQWLVHYLYKTIWIYVPYTSTWTREHLCRISLVYD